MNIRRAMMFGCAVLLLLAGTAASAAGKLQVTREAEINANADELWELVGEFGGLQNWHPAVVSSELTGTGMDAGDKRVLMLGDGGKIHETLQSWDNDKHEYSYVITESPLPVENYSSTLSVRPAGENKSVFTWSSTFDAKGASDEEAVKAITGVYDGGIEALKGMFK